MWVHSLPHPIQHRCLVDDARHKCKTFQLKLLMSRFFFSARLFHRDGYVVVNNVLTREQAHKLKTTCDGLIESVLERDPLKLGNRGMVCHCI